MGVWTVQTPVFRIQYAHTGGGRGTQCEGSLLARRVTLSARVAIRGLGFRAHVSRPMQGVELQRKIYNFRDWDRHCAAKLALPGGAEPPRHAEGPCMDARTDSSQISRAFCAALHSALCKVKMTCRSQKDDTESRHFWTRPMQPVWTIVPAAAKTLHRSGDQA